MNHSYFFELSLSEIVEAITKWLLYMLLTDVLYIFYFWMQTEMMQKQLEELQQRVRVWYINFRATKGEVSL